MRLYGGNRVPAHLGARSIVSFEMICVQFHQSRRQEVAFHIFANTGGAGRDIGDLAADELQRTENDIVGEHDTGVAQNRFISHCLRPPNRS